MPRLGRPGGSPEVGTRSPAWPLLVLAALGGVTTGMAFPGLGLWPLAFSGVGLLVLADGHTRPRRSAVVWFTWGVALFLPHLIWAREAAGTVAWLALVVLQAGVLALGGVVWGFARLSPLLNGRPAVRGVAFALTWVAVEQLRSVAPFGGFPWGRLGFSQADSPVLALASLGGVPLMSFTVALVGYLLAAAVDAVRRKNARSALLRAVAAVVVTGAGAIVTLPSAPQTGELVVGVVQGDVSTPPGADRARAVLENHAAGTRALAREGARPLDLVVWPENATDIDPRADEEAAGTVRSSAEAVGVPLLVGAMRYGADNRYNDIIVWDPERGATAAYTKQRPAPFGEYIPLRSFVRLLSAEVDRVPLDMAAGTEPAVLRVPVQRVGRDVITGTVICFEVAFDDVVRDAVVRGAEMLVVPTNNASFGRTAQSTQQLAMSRIRAVEHGRSTVQASTVGVSAVIAPDGTVMQETGLFTAETMTAKIPLRSALTIADRVGDAPAAAAVAVTSGLAVAGVWSTVRSRTARTDERARPLPLSSPR